MSLDLRLIRYFVAVAQEGNVTRAAERLHISQPSLSAAIKQLEAQLGVALLERRGRRISLTPAGELLEQRGRELLEQAVAVTAELRDRGATASGRLRVGMSPTARYGVGPELLAAIAREAPAVMVYSSEDTTGALLEDVARGRLDLALTFCAPAGSGLVREEPAVVHLPDGHPLAQRDAVSLADLAGETVLVAADPRSGGFSEHVHAGFAAAGVAPRTRPDPYPDLGLQAVREGLGVVVYVRSAYPADLPGSVFVPVEPAFSLPFHLVARPGEDAAVRAALEIAQRAAGFASASDRGDTLGDP